MIQLIVTGRTKLSATVTEPITTGSVGMPVEVELSNKFDGLVAWLVFDAGYKSADIALTGEPVTVPPQVLRVAGAELKVGVYGAKPDGTIVTPTVWTSCGTVQQGAEPSGFVPGDPAPSWAAQVEAIAEEALEVAQGVGGRVTSLDGTELAYSTVDAVGIPTYVSDVSAYEDYGITETGWYCFVRIKAKDGAKVTSATVVEGAAGSIVTVGEDHVDVAVRFEVAALSQTVTVTWAEGNAEAFVMAAPDLAVRNLDYRTTFYIYDLAPFVTWEYALTTDERFAEKKTYFTLEDGEYEPVDPTSYVVGDPATYHTRVVTHPPAPTGEAFVGTEYWVVDEQSELGHSRAAVMAGAPIPEGEYFTHSYQKLTAAGKFAEGVRYYKLVDDEYVLQEVTVGASYAKNVYYIDAWTAATGTFVGTAYCAETGGEWHQAAVVAGETIPEGSYGLHEVSWPQALGTFEAGVTYYNYVGAATGYEFDGCAWVHDAGMYEVAEVTPGDTIPEWYVHSKMTVGSGLTRNVTYRLDTPVDCPSEFILPEVEDEEHGCWYEMRFYHTGSYSSVLTPLSSDVKVATQHTQAETEGINMVDLHYSAVAGNKVWRFMNTHSTFTNTPALVSIEFRTPPTTTEYAVGGTLDTTGAEVVATYEDGTKKLVTPTYAPASGTALTAEDTELTASYTEGEVTATATTPLTITGGE